jgi:hypothetical protein
MSGTNRGIGLIGEDVASRPKALFEGAELLFWILEIVLDLVW